MSKNGSGLKLTITMLVSNRIDTIRKCMDSIKPLLEQVPSELIVVDTGSTDGSIDIVREYTDKVVPFAWCNDFAKARNAGLKDARGEWLMFLDDDEWFEDITEIIDFFDSGEYKNYNCGIYLVRNYANVEGTVWTDSTAQRMVRRCPETRFEGVIHEHISPLQRPVKYFSAYAHHYGYAYASEEAKREHFQRNIALMQKELEHEPDNIRMLAQEVQEYMGLDELYKTLELCERVMELCKQQPLYKAFGGYCYTISVRAYMKMEAWQKAYDWGEKLLAEGAPTSMAFLGIVREMLTICVRVKKYAEGMICLKKYLELYDALTDNVDREEICFDLGRYLLEQNHEDAYLEGIELAVLGKEWKLAEKCLLGKNWKKPPIQLYPVTLDYVMELWTAMEFRQEYADILDCVMKSAVFHKQVQNNMDKYAHEDGKAYRRLLRIFGNCKNDSAISRKYRFLYHASLERMPKDVSLDEMLEGLWEEAANPLLWDMEMWDVISRKKLSVLQEVNDTMYDRWFMQVRQWLEGSLQEESSGVDENDRVDRVYHALCQGGEASGNLHMQFLELKYQEGMMRRKLRAEEASVQMGHEEILSCLEKYCDRALEFYAQIYRQELFKEDMATLLPPEGAYAVYVKLAMHGRQEGNQGAYIQFIGKAAKCYPVMKELCKELLRKEKEESQNKITYDEQLEFIQLAERMKHNVKTLLENDNKETAKQIILQLKTLIPDDEELWELERAAREPG